MAVFDLWRTARAAMRDLSQVSDAELRTRFCRDRDAAAFELLVHRHGPMVWATCRRMLHDHHAAEDAFQATFLALSRRATRIHSSVPAWLHRVAVRASLTLLRRTKSLTELDREPIDHRSGPAELAATADVGYRIDQAINRLPNRLRNAFVLCQLHGYSLKEAAAELGCEVGTIESRLARARQQLRGSLAALKPSAIALSCGLVVPQFLRTSTVQAALGAKPISSSIATLAAKAGSTGWGIAVPGAVGALAAGLLIVAVGVSQLATPKPPATKSPPAADRPGIPANVETEDLPLPAGAIVRLGKSRFRHPSSYYGEIAFSPDGQQLATGNNSNAVCVFDTSTGRMQRTLTLTEMQKPRTIRFVVDGKKLAVGSSDWNKVAEFTVFNLADGKVIANSKFTGKSQIFVIDFTGDGGQVLVEDRFEKAYLWDVKTAKEVWSFPHPEATFTLPMTADGKSFALVMGRSAELRDASTGNKLTEFPAAGMKYRSLYHAAAISADGKLAVCTESGDSVAILDAKGADAVRELTGDRELSRLFFSPDSRYLVGIGERGTLVWDTKADAGSGPVAKLPSATGCGFSPNVKTIALDDSGAVTLWSVGDWKQLRQSADPATLVLKVRFSADGKQVIGYTRSGWLSWPVGGGPTAKISDDSPVHHEGLAAMSADRRVGVDVLHEPTPGRGKFAMRITNFATGKAKRIDLDQSGWNPVHITPDGRFVWMKSSDLNVWDAASGELIYRKPPAKGRSTMGAQIAPDGKSLVRSVTGEWNENGVRDLLGPMYSAVIVTDHRTGREWKMDPVPWSVYSAGVEFSPDGSKLIVNGRFDSDWKSVSVSVWDVATGRRLVNWKRDSGWIEPTSLANDGRSLLVGDESGKLVVLEVATGLERTSFRHGGRVRSTAFHPDGTKIVASSPEAPIYVWDLVGNPGKWDASKADAMSKDLASTDAKVAFAAMQKLRANPEAAPNFLKEFVKLPEMPADEKVAAWLKQLDSPKFAEREQAQKELASLADVLRPRLAVARKTATGEAAQRLDAILKTSTELTPAQQMHVRACEVLEGMASPDAIRVLKAWASGPEGARLTLEAQQSLVRLNGK